MRPHIESEAPPRPVTVIEIDLAGDSLIHFRREAQRRDMSVARLVHDLLDVIAADGLTAAILDDQAGRCAREILISLTPCPPRPSLDPVAPGQKTVTHAFSRRGSG
jgi:hypothetical protein